MPLRRAARYISWHSTLLSKTEAPGAHHRPKIRGFFDPNIPGFFEVLPAPKIRYLVWAYSAWKRLFSNPFCTKNWKCDSCKYSYLTLFSGEVMPPRHGKFPTLNKRIKRKGVKVSNGNGWVSSAELELWIDHVTTCLHCQGLIKVPFPPHVASSPNPLFLEHHPNS